MNSRKLCVLAACVAASLTREAPARAAPSSSPPVAAASSTPAPAPPQVEIAIVGDVPNADALGARIVSWFHGDAGHAHWNAQKSLDSSTVFAPTADPGVRVWVVVRSANSARLFFAVEERPNEVPRYLVNDVALDSGLDELGMEQLAHVVYLSAQGLWAGDVVSSRQEVEEGLREAHARAEVPPTVVAASSVVALPKAKAASDRGRVSFRIGVEGLARGGVADRLIWRAGLSLGVLQLREHTVLGAQLHAEDVAPSTVTQSGLNLAFSEQSVRLGFLAERKTFGHWWASAELGPGIDVLHYRATSSSDPTLQPAPAGNNFIPTVFANIASRWTLGAISIEYGFVDVVELVHTHYDIAGPNGRSTILTPWILQPGLFLGVYW